MRKIKFRVWDKERKRLCSIDAISTKNEIVSYADRADMYGVTFDRCIIEQFTGLTDKNKTEIFEGDICKFYPCKDEPVFFHGIALMNNNVVGGQWKIIQCDNVDEEIPSIKGEDCLDSSSFWNDDFEVIGNIHENPELIKK